jgi:hypothetical protein
MAKLKSGPKRNEKKHRELVDQISNWHATPEEYRADKTLSSLAKSIGVHANTDFYNLADSAEVYHKCLLNTAGGAIALAPEVLKMLYEKAVVDKNVKAAEVYLEFLRKTITDGGMLSKLMPSANVGEIMNNVEHATANLLELAKTLNNKPPIEAVEAQYSEGPAAHSDDKAEE